MVVASLAAKKTVESGVAPLDTWAN
jgi:hypothetical protein